VNGPLRVLIADDELLARRRLARLLGAMPDVAIAGECEDAESVLERARAGDVDVVLLDIQMPGLSGMDALQLWPRGGPQVIFCTAFADHAVAAFDAEAVDYLLKPVEPARLARALQRARMRASTMHASSEAPPAPRAQVSRLALPTRSGIVLVDPGDVSHAVLDGELVTVYTRHGDYLCDASLQDLESRLPAGRFERVHRRALLNLEHVVRLEPVETGGYIARTARGHAVEVSRQTARELRRRLGLR
jgi:two-component system LytT family response regulator